MKKIEYYNSNLASGVFFTKITKNNDEMLRYNIHTKKIKYNYTPFSRLHVLYIQS